MISMEKFIAILQNELFPAGRRVIDGCAAIGPLGNRY
jgi:hypothetical protein